MRAPRRQRRLYEVVDAAGVVVRSHSCRQPLRLWVRYMNAAVSRKAYRLRPARGGQ